ncbi:MAG TPA: PQQ-binding-like beta-propeller repeat protein, partial [Acidobacteriaceae bacterium]|nr:PQQ-binding-like beta-propeller repeat protein [Acidobacteriaceae bacterium]
DIPGEHTSPTQPFSSLPPLSPLALDLSKPLGITGADDARCRTILSHLRNNGMYTPVSFQGSLLFPSNVGGVNWGSTALDPATGILYANTNRTPFMIQLQRRPRFTLASRSFRIFLGVAALALVILALLLLHLVWRRKRGAGLAVALAGLAVIAGSAAGLGLAIKRHISNRPWLGTGVFAAHFGKEFGENFGVPYVLLRQPLQSEPGRPCSPTPWGTVSALNLNTGQTAWQTPLGTRMPGLQTGTINVGGPIVTAGGLVFTAASAEPLLRAFDAATGQQLWTGPLPVPAQATPMTYVANEKQFVIVAAGGHGALGTEGSDTLVAFSLRNAATQVTAGSALRNAATQVTAGSAR